MLQLSGRQRFWRLELRSRCGCLWNMIFMSGGWLVVVAPKPFRCQPELLLRGRFLHRMAIERASHSDRVGDGGMCGVCCPTISFRPLTHG